MNTAISGMERTVLLLIYAFIGWVFGVAYVALKDRRFANRGFLNLPLALSEGITAVILMEVLPTLEGQVLLQAVMTWVVVFVMDSLTALFLRNTSRRAVMAQTKEPERFTWQTVLLRTAEAGVYLAMYLLVHPFVCMGVVWLPDGLVTVIAIATMALVALDFMAVWYAMRSGRVSTGTLRSRERTWRWAQRLTDRIWDRLERAYPGLKDSRTQERCALTFAPGLCFDKLVWVFLVSSFLGALIEMVFCRVTGGVWMSRSSVLYGPFSIVWGLGAVVLTVVLRRLADKPDRYVFLAGFVVGGVYEYLCSVFTELVFGTVFWDYSYLPLNFGGRTNVLYCVFWGLLSVVWLKVLFPPMDRAISKLPPLAGKTVTWLLVCAMALDCALTGLAMLRYTQRISQPEPVGMVQIFLDSRYDDAFMESRWPNMILTK